MENQKILVIDDQEEIQEVLAAILEADGYQVRLASSVDEGVWKAGDETPDLILLDFMMPEKNGMEGMKELRAIKELANTPIIFLTGMMSNTDGEDVGINIDGKRYTAIAKPFTASKLLFQIRTALQNSNSVKKAV